MKKIFVPLCSVVFVIGLKKKMQVVAHTTNFIHHGVSDKNGASVKIQVY